MVVFGKKTGKRRVVSVLLYLVLVKNYRQEMVILVM